jgi:hypothetical protein
MTGPLAAPKWGGMEVEGGAPESGMLLTALGAPSHFCHHDWFSNAACAPTFTDPGCFHGRRHQYDLARALGTMPPVSSPPEYGNSSGDRR